MTDKPCPTCGAPVRCWDRTSKLSGLPIRVRRHDPTALPTDVREALIGALEDAENCGVPAGGN